MSRCLELAAKAKQAGKTAVGALIVENGKIISEGFEGEEELPGLLAHAEILAILRALPLVSGGRLDRCILYTTVEPCFMCSYAIRQTGISKVVYGTPAGGTGGALSAYPLLTAADIDPWTTVPEVTGGIMRKACWDLLHEDPT